MTTRRQNMTPYEKVKAKLDELNISYDMVEHPAVYTTEEADKYIEGKVGIRTKSLFLTDNKKRRYYLVFMGDDKRLNMKEFAEIIGEKHLKFASENLLMEKLGLKPGFVSIFGLLNNTQKDVQVYFEKDIVSDIPLTFHPNDNTKTMFIGMDDLKKFLNSLDFRYHIVSI